MLETGGHGAPGALGGLASLPHRSMGPWPAMAERNLKMRLEVTEVLGGFGVSWESGCYLHPPAFSLAQSPVPALSPACRLAPRSACRARGISRLRTADAEAVGATRTCGTPAARPGSPRTSAGDETAAGREAGREAGRALQQHPGTADPHAAGNEAPRTPYR